MMMNNLYFVFSVVAAIIITGCSSAENISFRAKPTVGERVKNRLGYVQEISDGNFSLYKIESIFLLVDEIVIFEITPVNIREEKDVQVSGWEVEYLAEDNVLRMSCGDDWRLTKDRLMGERRSMMLNTRSMYLDIGWGVVDNVVVVFQKGLFDNNTTDPGSYVWRHEGGGILCSGTAGFVLTVENEVKQEGVNTSP